MPGLYDDVIICKLRSQPDNVQTEHTLPLKMYVRGCPFVIVETSLGMSYGPRSADYIYEKNDEKKNEKDVKKMKEHSVVDEGDEIGKNDNIENENNNENEYVATNNNEVGNMKSSLRGSINSRGRPLLLMGHVCTNAPRPTRTLQIKNQGSKIGIITWTCTTAFPDRKKDR